MIRSPGNLVGLKMRVPPQEIYILTAQAFGASPQEMPASEIYSALKTGVLDGQDNPPSNIWDYNIHEVQQFMTITNYSTGPDPFIVDLDWYKRLPADLQEIFDSVAIEAMAYSDRLNRREETAYIKKLEQVLEVNIVDGSALREFQELSAPVYQFYVEQGTISEAEIRRAKMIARSAN